MNANTEIDLDALHDAVVSNISNGMPAVASVQSYPSEREALPLPAVVVDLEDMEAAPDADPGTEQLAVLTRWRARLILGFRTADVQRQVRKGASKLAHLVHLNRWGQPVGPARVTLVGPDPFDPDLDQYEVWVVEWEQLVHLGASVWECPLAVPDTVFLGIEPDTGPDHIDDYRQIVPAPDL
ncbi:hypothetical protein T8A63_15250 [Sulfitobacter sp. OXR-159]|uniref:hypothetical protein n=1 Tax=Sulfitobacter sp. OXR-159 TaxID=3100174 RepID=UPI002AC953EA|nr:hypothetical protein [Sulfitobacter sp. OXR-159]WPZ28970.1 hypothetical protein T8A63_15250 [Sulfitobacter sp. OXR-159]